jgi:hypothetical protein
METEVMSNFGRKTAIAAVAFATVGSTLFGGAALASGGYGGESDAGGGGIMSSCSTVSTGGSPGSVLSATAGTGPIPPTVVQNCTPAAATSYSY